MRCTLCKECKYPNWTGKLMYPEDKNGIPYCNSEGPLSARSREILINIEVPYDKVIPYGPNSAEYKICTK